MSGIFLCKSLLHVRRALSATSSTRNLFLLENYPHPPLFFSLKCISSNTNTAQHSYLINSCGLSPESALSASKGLHFKTPDKPDKIICFLINHGFSKIQIAKLIKGFPKLLTCVYPEKSLLPKIDLFYSKGMSSTDLLKMLSNRPKILALSLEDRLIPFFYFMKSLLDSDDNIILAVKRYSAMLTHDYQSYIVPNVDILRQYGVTNSSIMYLLSNRARIFFLRPNRFKNLVEEVKLIVINPLKLNFVLAVSVKRSLSKSTLVSKHNAFKHWGLSDKEIFSAFVVDPRIMTNSKSKIMATMDFLVNELGWESSGIIQHPEIVGMSLMKRIIPRCCVIKVLWSKGLINKAVSLYKVFHSSEKMFPQKFVFGYEEGPDLLKIYQETLGLSK